MAGKLCKTVNLRENRYCSDASLTIGCQAMCCSVYCCEITAPCLKEVLFMGCNCCCSHWKCEQ